MRVAFVEQSSRDRIYKARTKIEDRSVWIMEDLTQKRREIAFKAREAVRHGLAAQTWTLPQDFDEWKTKENHQNW